MNDLSPKDKEFQTYFGVRRDIFQDRRMTMITGKYSLDIIRLDDWLHKAVQYSEEKDGSMKNFIREKFGEEAAQFIEGLLN